MASIPTAFLLLSICTLSIALDCRKFSFAPACRGIMLKRASPTNEQFELATRTCMTPAEVIGKVMEAASMAGYTDTVDMNFLHSFYNKALAETLAMGRV